jgi:ribosomal-protein-alanine N-acetyltransferase
VNADTAAPRPSRDSSIRLRASRPEELPLLYEWYENPDIVAPFDRFDTEPFEEFELKLRTVESDPASTAPRFVIARNADDRPIGFVGYYRAHPVLEIWDVWYVIGDVAERGKGLGRQAVAELVQHLFESRPIPRVGATTDIENVRSYRLLEGLGFAREGRLSEVLYHHGRWHDVFVYGLSRRAWEARGGPVPRAGTEAGRRPSPS